MAFNPDIRKCVTVWKLRKNHKSITKCTRIRLVSSEHTFRGKFHEFKLEIKFKCYLFTFITTNTIKKILWYFCLAIKACQFIHWIQSVIVLQSGNLVRLAVKRIFRFHLSKVLILFGKMVGIYTNRSMPPYRTRWGYQLQVLLTFYYCSITIRFYKQIDLKSDSSNCYRSRYHLF